MNRVLEEDIEEIVNCTFISWSKLKNKCILVTGATGLIGSIMIKSILKRNLEFGDNIKLVLVVRNIESAIEIFGNNSNISYIETSIDNYIVNEELKIDYIVHGASITRSKLFISNPVETIDVSIIGTKNILEQAKASNIKSMVYLSSMEMYGTMNLRKVTESDLGYIDPLNVRSSYSESKRACELYCVSYKNEYKVPVKIARLAQTFGAGISQSENRVFKVFAEAIINKEDIVLKSMGTTLINFSYTTDTILGILKILTDGEDGEPYNIVSDNLNMNILDSANWLIETYGDGTNKVKIEIPKENMGFAPNNQMILCNEKLKRIGWNCKYNLKDGYDRLIKFLKEELKKG